MSKLIGKKLNFNALRTFSVVPIKPYWFTLQSPTITGLIPKALLKSIRSSKAKPAKGRSISEA